MQWPPCVVCFGGEDWWYHNRGHCDMQFMRSFSRHGRVLYINSIVMRKFNVSEGKVFLHRMIRKTRSIFRGLVRVSDAFWVYSPVAAPVHHLSWARAANERLVREQVRGVLRCLRMHRPLIWVNCPAACDTALALPRWRLVYQRTDRYEEHPGVDREQITRYDRTLRQRADLTFYSNRQLYSHEVRDCRRAAYVEHGVDYEMFGYAARDPWVPAEVRNLRHPIAGFFGAIDEHKFNVPLITDVATRLSYVTFVFVGNASIDCTALASLPNVVMVDQRPYEQIPHYGKCFDVCIMPFQQNRWIDAFNPIKLKEYLALGKPVVTTAFGELKEYGSLVHIAVDAASFAHAIGYALANESPDAIKRRRDRAVRHSWSSKARQVLSMLQPDDSRGPSWDRTHAVGC
ncbi:MAG: glycosyltransferase [Phycisphaerales bacterium]|nr:MAG: glycosyltransferase [Phycisphaerales bacterium]